MTSIYILVYNSSLCYLLSEAADVSSNDDDLVLVLCAGMSSVGSQRQQQTLHKRDVIEIYEQIANNWIDE